jgi:hypothetical protein
MKKIFSFSVLVCVLFSFNNIVFAAPPSAALSTTSILYNGQINPGLTIDLSGGPIFEDSSLSQDINNWTLYSNTTGLSLLSIIKTSDTSVTVNLSGTTLMGSLQLAVETAAILAGTPVTPVTVTVQPTEITYFDSIYDINAGTTENVLYANAITVEAALPTTVEANSGLATIPVVSWIDTDTYNPLIAGSYTFTAVLGVIPSGFLNTGDYRAVVEVVINNPIIKKHKTSGSSSPAIMAAFQIEQEERAKSAGLYTPDTSEQTTSIPKRIMKRGMTGDDVKNLQTYLNTHLFDCGLIDGKFGQKTKTAVIKFQLTNGLKEDGIVGPITISKMK